MFKLYCIVLGLCLVSTLSAAAWDSWPPRDYLMKCIVKAVPRLLDSYHPETGKFGTEPWVYQDQMPIFVLAAAWSIEHEKNPYYHDAELLAIIARGGEVWLEQQNAQGQYRLLRKNGDDWGLFYSSFVHSHWAKTYALVGDALPAASRAKWKKGIVRGLEHIVPTIKTSGVNNQPLRHALALYIAGGCFGKDDWKRVASEYMVRTAAAQDPAGFWSEHAGPALAYSFAYSWFLGIYEHFSHDPAALDALKRASEFHLKAIWPDGTLIPCIDERTLYSKAVRLGNPGFSYSPEGRAFLLHQLRLRSPHGRGLVDAEYAADMLLYGAAGKAAASPALADQATSIIGAHDAIIQRRKPWQWAFSGYTSAQSTNRWFQDRQNLIDVYHDALGLVIGGGNTKCQPYWSSFTVGDPSLAKPPIGNTHPDFTPQVDLKWTPDAARLRTKDGCTTMALDYGGIECRAEARVDKDGRLALIYSAPTGRRVEAHVPFLRRATALQLASGREVKLARKKLALSAHEIGDHFVFAGLKVSVPSGASLRWPAWQFNPYRKDGRSSITTAKLVLVLPFDRVGEYAIHLERESGAAE